MDVQEIKNTIHALVEKYESNRNFYRTLNFNETQVRNEFLDPLFEVLGWDIRNMSGKKTNEREVLLEESLKADAATHSKKPDYTFRLFGERKFFLEAKKPCVDISTDDNPAKQVRRYGYTANLKISVLSNFEDLYIYDTSYKVEDGDTLVKARIKAYHYTDYENVAEELLELVGKESVYTGHFEEVWDDIELNVVHQSVDSLFLEQINQWRLMLGQQILSCDPDLEIDYLGDIVQSYINKILFLRVCEDRNIETYQRLLTIADHNSHKELVAKFKEADNKYNSGLFEELISEDVIGNISSSFWMIIRQLYFPESPYSFTVLSSDILGRIYEIFLAEKLAVVDGELKIVKKPENAERDIVTTPNFVVREILHQTAAEIIQGKTANEINNLKCADIACGSGAFLLELYQLLYDSLVDYYFENDRSKLVQTSIDTYKLPYEMKRNLLVNCIYGVDKDFNAVEACKFGLLLKLLEDEDVNSLSSFHPILPDLSNNIFYGNSLLSTADVPADDAFEINPFDFGDRTFDLIVGNPPYMKTEDIKAFTPKEKSLYEKGSLQPQAAETYQTLANEVSGAPVTDLTQFANDYLNVFSTGFHYAFAVAIVAMLVSLIIYVVNKKRFPDPSKKVADKSAASVATVEMSAQEVKQRIMALFAVFGVVIFFWFSFHQNGLTLTFFAKEYTDLNLFGMPITAELFQSLNPFFVVFLTPVVMAVFARQRARGKEPSTPKKIAIGMGIAATGFIIMAVGSFVSDQIGRAHV